MTASKREFLHEMAAAAAAAIALGAGPVFAQARPFKIGLLLPMTGPFASTGRQIDNGVRLYMAQFGTKVAGRDVQIVLRRYRSAGYHETPGAGVDRQRQGRCAGRIWFDAAGACGGADCHSVQDANGRDGGGDFDHRQHLTVHRSHQHDAAAGDPECGGMGSEERN